MNKLKENVLNDVKKCGDTTIQAMKLPTMPPIQAMKLPALPTPPPPQNQLILIYMVLVYLLPLPLVFAYFLDITLSGLKIKNKGMKKNKINHQNDAICFKILYNE